jgi:feruloyl esterase
MRAGRVLRSPRQVAHVPRVHPCPRDLYVTGEGSSMRNPGRQSLVRWAAVAAVAGSVAGHTSTGAQVPTSAPGGGDQVVIGAADCAAEKVGARIPAEAIGEPVRMVTLSAPAWTEETANSPGYCRVNGVIEAVDTSATARPINFAVALPARWMRRSVQLGGGGMNGSVPNLTGGSGAGSPSWLARGMVTYGSDSGHQAGFGPPGGARGGGRPGGAPAGGGAAPSADGRGDAGRRGGGPPAAGQGRGAGAPAGGPGRGAPGPANEWALNDEAIANLGHMQMKKTHDAAMVLIERLYGARPRFTYYIGGSQGGREALTVAQRYPADYSGIAANVPIVGFSTLMLAPELIRIQEKPLANWVPPAKVNAIRGEFMRQCDTLDGLADGIINNYMACRAIFDVTQGERGRRPWSATRCPGNVDPNPADTSASACLTDGQIATLEFTYSRYAFATPLAHGTTTFGMWVPNTDPSGSGLIAGTRFRGQEGAAETAAMHSHLGVLGVTGFLMRNLSANPLDYVEGGPLNARRVELSAILDATNPDLSAFEKRGGRMIVTIGTNDTLASPGAQLDYYQSVVDKMGRPAVDRFARLFVMPQAGHGLSGTSYGVDGTGKTITPAPIPNRYDQTALLFDWVERQIAPPMSVDLTAGERSLPLCSYPTYPRYVTGPTDRASSYRCTQ